MISSSASVSPLAIIEEGVTIGDNSKIWEFAKIRSGAVIGSNVVVGQGVYIGPKVRIGDNCKIQNYALLYEPCELGHGVFVGPGVIFTNDKHPRAINDDGTPKLAHDWTPEGVLVGDGASIGAGAICVAPVSVGKFALVAAGAVVVRDVGEGDTVRGVPAQ